MGNSADKRVANLRALIARYRSAPDPPSRTREVLLQAPSLLDRVERALRRDDPKIRREALNLLEEFERIVALTITGDGQAPRGQSGDSKPAENVHHPDQRLAEKLGLYAAKRTAGPAYDRLQQEWIGGLPGSGSLLFDERQANLFTYWLLHDVEFEGRGGNLVGLFAGEMMEHLPREERELLRRWLRDRPSIYQIVAVRPGKGFDVHDVLVGEILRVSDETSSLELRPGAVVIARIIPTSTRGEFATLGAPVEVPERLYDDLASFLRETLDRHTEEEPGRPVRAHFRATLPALLRHLRELSP